ncbi:Aspartic proteinase CDR1 [Melia azedarach]|uniref:Aspartic proteinase CDR1 n=1 Tax=Melia azedarach TaxID=155640 RepID=A0ACC1Z0F5_MELAZ|nr:Aspartic proteinase CDR1 [Melia azedarach]
MASNTSILLLTTFLLCLTTSTYSDGLSHGTNSNPSQLGNGKRVVKATESETTVILKPSKKYCVPKPRVSDEILQANIDWGCKMGVDCDPLVNTKEVSCSDKSLWIKAAYVMNYFFNANARNESACDFNKTGFLTRINPKATNNGGFSVDLIHRDSPNSPLYNSHKTPNDAQASVSADGSNYLIKFSIGTPPKEFYGFLDTGSDLTWTQCLPCESCYKQLNPIYDPAKSSSYKDISCQSKQCRLLDTTSCSSKQICNYTSVYGRYDQSKGVLATETITFGSSSGNSSTVFDNIIFGCGHNNTGWILKERQMGIVGLGDGNLSLISQIFSRLGTNKFSYCLVPANTNPNISSKMYFGSVSEVSGDGVVSTALVSKGNQKNHYFVTLEGISVGNKFIPYNSSTRISKGNFRVDSGMRSISLPDDLYFLISREVMTVINLPTDPPFGTVHCYKKKSMVGIAPIITLHFEGGAKLPLGPEKTFHPTLGGDGSCFAIHQNGDIGNNDGIMGSFALSNTFVGIDIDNKIVSFKPTDCTKQ